MSYEDDDLRQSDVEEERIKAAYIKMPCHHVRSRTVSDRNSNSTSTLHSVNVTF